MALRKTAAWTTLGIWSRSEFDVPCPVRKRRRSYIQDAYESRLTRPELIRSRDSRLPDEALVSSFPRGPHVFSGTLNHIHIEVLPAAQAIQAARIPLFALFYTA